MPNVDGSELVDGSVKSHTTSVTGTITTPKPVPTAVSEPL